MDTILQVKDLFFRRDTNFCLKVPEIILNSGDVCAITGQSGCGKSTLLECLGLLHKDTMALMYKLKDVDVLRADNSERDFIKRHYLGFMPQVNGLIPFLSVEENIRTQIEASIPPSVHDKKVYFDKLMTSALSLCKDFGIDKLLHKKAHEISVGQRQRAVFVRASAHRPYLMLIDEPTSALDPKRALDLFSCIKDMCHKLNITALVVTHDKDAVINLGYKIFDYKEDAKDKDCSVFVARD